MTTTFASTTTSLALDDNLDPFILIKPSTTVNEALSKLRGASEKFALIGEATSQPDALLSEGYLEKLNEVAAQQTLTQVREKIPALFVVHHEVDLFKEKRLEVYSHLLYGTTAPGIVIWDGEKAIGAFSIETIFDRAGRYLDPVKYAQHITYFINEPVKARRVYDILAADVNWCEFFCTHPDCDGLLEEPSCQPPPTCPRNSNHGPMRER